MKVSVALLSSAVVLSACGSGAGDDRPTIVTAFYPYTFVAERLVGDAANVESLTSPGTEAHDLELRPRQVAAVQDADVVIYQRGFQAAVDDAIDQADRPDDTTIDAAALAPEEDHADEETDTEEAGEDHANEEAADEHEGHDHDHEGADPHLWLDPTFMESVVDEASEAMTEALPEQADQIRANAEELKAELSALDEQFTTGLAQCRTRTIVTSHAAFGHLAERYDLTQVAIAGLEPSDEPSGRQLADIADEVESLGITTIFSEELVDPANAETIATATGAELAVLDPIEGLGPDTNDQTYLTLMERNLAAIQKANSCT